MRFSAQRSAEPSRPEDPAKLFALERAGDPAMGRRFTALTHAVRSGISGNYRSVGRL
jgi:hypothetical protein